MIMRTAFLPIHVLLIKSIPRASCLSINSRPIHHKVVVEVDEKEHVRIHIPNSPLDFSNQGSSALENPISKRKRDGTATKSQLVLDYERKVDQMHQVKRASPAPPKLEIVFLDEHVVVVDKPPGVLCVPDINKNPNMLDLVWNEYGNSKENPSNMIINRLDMDTSGLVVFARTLEATKRFQTAFRERLVTKEYEALLCGHVPFHAGIIDLPLQRDVDFPPFMRIATPESETAAAQLIAELQASGYKKQGRKKPKPSQTEFRVIERTILSNEQQQQHDDGPILPVTRIRLSPQTGRTHQLRVHCAAIGHPMVGDPTYGVTGDANPFGGLVGESSDYSDQSTIIQHTSLDILNAIAQIHRPNIDPMCLHAALLRLKHPFTGEMMEWNAPVPF